MTVFPIHNHTQRAVLAVSVIGSILPVVAVSLRILSHRLAHRSLSCSDCCAVLAAVFAVGFHAALIAGVVQGGLGWGHVSDLVAAYGAAPVERLLQLNLALELCWALSLSFSKTSILLLYGQLFRDSYMVVASRVVATAVLLWAVEVVLASLLMCRPIGENWRHAPGGHCGDQVTIYFVNGLVNLATDVTVILLPLPHLYRLRMPKHTKVVLSIVLSLGLLTCIASILRLVFMDGLDLEDMTWSLPLPGIFTGLEPSMATTLCCVPLLRPLLGAGKRQRPSRVRVAGNTLLRTHQYDPEHAGKLKLRPDHVGHSAVVHADPASRERGPVSSPRRAVAVAVAVADDSISDLKTDEGHGPEITVNRQWLVTSEVGDWTQILGSR